MEGMSFFHSTLSIPMHTGNKKIATIHTCIPYVQLYVANDMGYMMLVHLLKVSRTVRVNYL